MANLHLILAIYTVYNGNTLVKQNLILIWFWFDYGV